MNILSKFLVCLLVLFSGSTFAQSISYRITNKQINANSVSFDVSLQGTPSFKLGDGQVYINYNSDAFGIRGVSAGRITVTKGSVLSQTNLFPIYGDPIVNDNTNDRFSVAWEQQLSSGSMPADNITNAPATLFHVEIEFIPGGSDEASDGICFQFGGAFENQTYLACGPDTGPPTFASCTGNPNDRRLTNDSYFCPSTSLPVELIDFVAEAQPDQTSMLTWKTATELNNSHFEVEHSLDGVTYERIGKVRGAGTTDVIQHYDFLHRSPEVGTNYYRLKQVDFDGAFEYSPVEAVNFGDERTGRATISAYPNPGVSYVMIRQSGGKLEKPWNVDVYDIQGRLIESFIMRDDTYRLDTSEWPTGVYHIRLNNEERIEQIRFVKD
jgi:hypothetical protein